MKKEIQEIVGTRSAKTHSFKITRYRIEGRTDYERLINDLLPDVDLTPYKKEPTYGYRISEED